MSYERDDNHNFFCSDKAHVRLQSTGYRGGETYSLQRGHGLLQLLGAHPLGFYEKISRVPQCYVFTDLEDALFLVYSLVTNVSLHSKVELSRVMSGQEHRICFTSEYPKKRRYTIFVRRTFVHPWNSECNYRDCLTVEASSIPFWRYQLKKFFEIFL